MSHGTNAGALSKLVLYDLLILWRSGRAAFSRKRDILLLAAASVLGLLIAIERAGPAAAAFGAIPILGKAAIAAAAAFGVNLAARRRLAHLQQESPVARYALRRAEMHWHALLWNLLALCAVVALILLSSTRLRDAALLAVSYLAGILAAVAATAAKERLRNWWARRRRGRLDSTSREFGGRTRRERIVQLLVARSGLSSSSVVTNLLLAAGIGLLIGVGHAWLASQWEGPAANVLAAVITLAVLLFLLRSRPALLRYLLFHGTAPLLPALVAQALGAALIAGLMVGMMISPPAPPIAIAAGAVTLLILFFAASLLRTLHYSTKSRAAAEIAIQIDLLAAALAGFLALPLAAVVLGARLWLLTRRAQELRYMLP